MSDFYELLNVPSTASFEEIKCSYKQLILQCHPDKLRQLDDPNPGSEAQNSDFNAINAAWNTLKDPIRRKYYDAELLQSKFQAHSNIYASVELDEMQRIPVEIEEDDEASPSQEPDADKGPATMWSYAYDCRCGGQYLFDGPGDNESSEVIVECNECSLVIIVNQPTTCK
ncbi:DPH4 homolog [Drosophila rhopaloa]|uniref:DPH4 homolog n=1 Tax=Drosophila rhopaloa TaxID=1041015 RepID=A0ABM5J3D1_DRORH|nr:DPH4 homolog [Drosophila rhopaloa]XP_044313323.1 DPH4 homolog [Drosophila rhopaloa]XP_044313324.1 DPH4 homolog [Drosophila rhopaloa]XP_044313325.1 DPH4 homolog [Drosophila rhopaloa]XP_044313326.1 DPH4 homolog [Drosophila rhopaloa]